MALEIILVIAAALIPGVLAHVLARRAPRGVWVLWALVLLLGAVVYWLGTQATGHSAGIAEGVFLLVIWTPAVLGSFVGTVLGFWR